VDNPFAPRYDQHQEPHPRQISFEGERVRIVLDRFGLSQRIPAMIERFREKWNTPWLTFETFFELYPTFPVLLEAHSFYHVADHGRPADLFRSFERTFFLQRYLDVYARGQEEAQGRPVGMVFPFDGFQGGLVMHNGVFNTQGTKLVHAIAGDVPPQRVTVEPFIGLVNYLAQGDWTPQAPLPSGHPAQQPQGCRDMPVTPWMVERLGPGPALVVLAWLRTVLSSPSGHDRRYVRRTGEGERCVAATQEEIASETRLSERRVKRGIEKLGQEGLLTSARRQGRSHIWLAPEALALAEEAAATER
jgi:hypothetical protein